MVWQNNTPGFLYNLHFSPDKKRAIFTRETSSFNHSLFEVNLVNGTVRRLLNHTQPIRIPACCYTKDGHGLYLTTDLDSDYLYVASLDPESGEIEKVAAPNWDCSGLALSPDGSHLAYLININGVDAITTMHTSTFETRQCPAPNDDPGIVQGGSLAFAPDSQSIAFSFSSATHTPDIYLWELATDNLRQMTRSSHGGLPTDEFVKPRLIQYPTFDYKKDNAIRKIPAWLYKPGIVTENSRLPVVIMPHGGPESQFRPAFHFLIQYFVHHGYCVLAPNVRGSTGYGKHYSHLDDVRKRMDSVKDLAFAAFWLKAQPEIDPARVIVYGGSYGGFMVLAALTTYPALWAAGVDIVGISNLATFLENTSDYRRAHREAEYGSLDQDRDFLEEIAPINHIDRIKAPLIVIHGANDPRVPLSEAEQLVDALKSRNIDVEFLVFEDEGHGLVKLKNKQIAYPAIINFLDEVLGC
jgi:dipeptidyl aminopeptidase/acylaminoacyl peptidase